jgi:hypothetical protein
MNVKWLHESKIDVSDLYYWNTKRGGESILVLLPLLTINMNVKFTNIIS